MSIKIKMPGYVRIWVRCPYCGAKVTIYDNAAECHGVFLKCSRGCKREFELVIHEGKQQLQNTAK